MEQNETNYCRQQTEYKGDRKKGCSKYHPVNSFLKESHYRGNYTASPRIMHLFTKPGLFPFTKTLIQSYQQASQCDVMDRLIIWGDMGEKFLLDHKIHFG